MQIDSLSTNRKTGLCTSVQALAAALKFEESIESSFGILLQFGEDIPRAIGETDLVIDIDQMINILQSTSNDSFYNMQENNDKKITALINMYVYLADTTYYFKPWLLGSVSLRMVELTMKTGLSPMSPLVFAYFGGLLVTIGYVSIGCRLGELYDWLF